MNDQQHHETIRDSLAALLESLLGGSNQSPLSPGVSRIDLEITVYQDIVLTAQRLLADTQRRRNTLARITRKLPPEILLQIFRTATSSDYQYYASLSMLRLVCSDWDEMIKDRPTFWNRAYCGDTANECRVAVERSADLPLYVFFSCRTYLSDPPHHHHGGFRAHVMREAHRWRSLVINATQMIETPRYLGIRVPNLVSLKIVCEYMSMLPQELFPYAPALRTLHLRRCILPWDSHLLRNLLSLTLIDIPHEPRQFAAVLKACPDLTYLNITKCSLGIPLEVSKPTPADLGMVIHLPFLKTLALASIPFLAIHFYVTAIEAPSLTSLLIAAIGFPVEDQFKLLDPLIPMIERVDQNNVSPLISVTGTREKLTLSWTGCSIRVLLPGWSKHPALDESVTDWTPILSRLSQSLCVRVTTLTLKFFTESEQTTTTVVKAFHDHFPSVTTLVLQEVWNTALSCLGQEIFPQVSTLHLDIFNGSELVRDVIRARSKSSCPITRLKVTGNIIKRQAERDKLLALGASISIELDLL